MRRKYFFAIFVSILFLLTGCGNDKNIQKLYTRNSLDVLSESGDYIIALSEKKSECNLYSMYKFVDYESYEKIWDFSCGGDSGLELKKIIWTSDKIYYFEWSSVESFDIKTGKNKLSSGLFYSDTGEIIVGQISTLYGTDGKYIYYKGALNSGDIYYGKISMDLSEVRKISLSDIPSDLSNSI